MELSDYNNERPVVTDIIRKKPPEPPQTEVRTQYIQVNGGGNAGFWSGLKFGLGFVLAVILWTAIIAALGWYFRLPFFWILSQILL